jgi:hypothetical protein
MIRKAGMDESEIRLANALPFRPIERYAKRALHNRRPTEKELRDYGPIVAADIATVRPKLIIALGTSATSLFGASTTIDRATRRLRLGQSYRDAGLVAGQDLRAAEVATIRNRLERIGLYNGLVVRSHGLVHADTIQMVDRPGPRFQTRQLSLLELR